MSTRNLTATVLAAGLLLAGCKGTSTSATSAGDAGAKPTKANPVVVVLDMSRLVSESSLSQTLQQELKSWAEEKQADLRTRAQSLQSAEARQAKPAEVDAMKRELYQAQETAKQEFQKRQAEAADRMKKTFAPLVQSLAEENGWDLVLNKSEALTIYAGQALDQTDFVLARLNAAPAADPAVPDPAL